MKLSRGWGIVLGLVALLCGGCLHLTTRTDPKVHVSDFKNIYVIHLLTDGRGVDQMIARELRHRGYNATYGARSEMPAKVDAVIIYDDTWTTDMTTYMISLSLQVRTPRTDKPLAVAFAHQPSLTLSGGRALKLIDKIVNKLFVQKPPFGDLPSPSPYPDFGITVQSQQ